MVSTLEHNKNQKAQIQLQRAENYFNAGEIEKAHPLLLSLLKGQTDHPQAYYMLGTIFYEKGQFKKSIACYKKALELDPSFTDSAIGLSVVLNDLGKYEEAQKVFITAQNNIKKEKKLVGSKVKDQIAEHLFDLCKLYQDDRQPDKAMESLISYENIKGKSELTVKEKVNIYHCTSNFKKACLELSDYISLTKGLKNPELKLMLAENYYLNRQPIMALSTCEDILKEYPSFHKAAEFYKKLKHTKFEFSDEVKLKESTL